jgi:hypothetical protein
MAADRHESMKVSEDQSEHSPSVLGMPMRRYSNAVCWKL